MYYYIYLWLFSFGLSALFVSAVVSSAFISSHWKYEKQDKFSWAVTYSTNISQNEIKIDAHPFILAASPVLLWHVLAYVSSLSEMSGSILCCDHFWRASWGICCSFWSVSYRRVAYRTIWIGWGKSSAEEENSSSQGMDNSLCPLILASCFVQNYNNFEQK